MHVFQKVLCLHGFAVVCLSSNSVSARTEGGGVLSKKWTGIDWGRERGLKTGKGVRTSFMDGPLHIAFQSGLHLIPVWSFSIVFSRLFVDSSAKYNP